jgi:hypothetical protein
MIAAGTCAALAGLVVLTAFAGGAFTALSVLLVQALLLTRWFRLVDAPAAAGGTAVALVVGGGADGVLALTDTDTWLEPLAGLVALSFLAALLMQILRRDGRERLVASFTATLAATVVVTMASLLVAVTRLDRGGLVVAAAMGGAVVASAPLARLVAGMPGPGRGTPAAVQPPPAAATTPAHARHRAPARRAPGDPLAAACLSIALAGPVAYVGGRLLLGG